MRVKNGKVQGVGAWQSEWGGGRLRQSLLPREGSMETREWWCSQDSAQQSPSRADDVTKAIVIGTKWPSLSGNDIHWHVPCVWVSG